MKIIVLHTVHYVSHNGITLSRYNPFVEATEENIEKLNKFIQAGYLTIVEETEAKEEDKIPETIPVEKNDEVVKQEEEIKNLLESVKRSYTEEELKEKTKNEIIDLLKEEGLSFKATMKKEELIDILVG